MDPERRQTWAGARDRVLRSHGAVVPPYEGWRQPANFRQDTLIVPADLLAAEQAAIEAAVKGAGLEMEIRAPVEASPGCPAVVRVWRERDTGGVVASSAALDAIHADPKLRGVSRDRLLMGCAMVGEGPPTAGHSDPGAGGYPHLWPERGGRIPVLMPEPEPLRVPERVGDDRPVIAVLDSGLGRNAWLGVDADGRPAEDDRFLVVDDAIQNEIRSIMKTAAKASPAVQIIKDGRDTPWSGDGQLRDIDSHLGHGTFIAALYRRLLPTALIQMIRVMYSDGIVYESAAVTALWQLHRRIEIADGCVAGNRPVDRSGLVDIVSLSFGGFFRDEAEEKEGSPLFRAIDALRRKGVIVVTAAGNTATNDRFYPAALAEYTHPEMTPVISVGALNPNGTRAAFSNYGPWVNYHAPGVSIISAMPDDIQGPMSPTYEFRLSDDPDDRAYTLDPDDFSSGHAIWSGTSFATAFAAADIARALVRTGDLAAPATRNRIERARRALAGLRGST